jgi:hypothetical protein
MVRPALVLAVIAVVAASDVRAAVVAPDKPSQLVTAIRSATAPPCLIGVQVDQRVLPDGSWTPFVIPDGQVFIVTAYEFHKNEVLPDGEQVFGQLVVVSPSSVGFVSRISAIMKGLNAFASREVPSGIVVNSRAKLCLDSSGNIDQADIIVHGFFARDR